MSLVTLVTALVVVAQTPTAEQEMNNVVIVLDRSGSMNDEMPGGIKMDVAKRALKTVLAKLPADTNVGLLVLPGREWVYRLSRLKPSVLNPAIDRIVANNDTPLGEHMKIGADALLQRMEAQYGYGTYRLLVVTDGRASDEDRTRRYAQEIPRRGITMDVIGVAMDSDHELKKYASTYSAANSAAQLEHALSAALSAESFDSAAAEDQAFEVLAGISDQAALNLLATMTDIPTHGLGDKPRPRFSAQVTGRVSPGSPSQPSSCGGCSSTSTSGMSGMLMLAALLLSLSLRRRRQ